MMLPLGKAVLKESVAYDKEKRVEGTLTRLLYLVPAERSTLEIYKNYEEELKKADFTILYECRGDDECGKLFHQAIWSQERAQTSDRGDVYALLYIARNASSVPEWASKRVTVLLEVLETAKMDNNMVKVDADKMSKEIDVSGHIALYGIYFDVDKSDIKSESAPLLSEIAKLLKHNPSLSLYVVGHTDNTGTFEHNQNLSRERAESVVKFLIQKEHIDAKRLKGYGVGPLAPIATNDTEEGKAKNRRVELIKQ
ncbi:MAG: DUF4892 domain-containing protein [Sulfurovaceae bacterium]